MPDDDEQPNPSELAVTDQHGEVAEDQIARATENAREHPNAASVGEAMQDPESHQETPFDEHAVDPSSSQLDGDMGVSSARTTPQHERTHGTQETAPGSFDAPDVSTDAPAPDQDDYKNKSWGGAMRVGGEPKPAPIEDEKVRRDNIDPTPIP